MVISEKDVSQDEGKTPKPSKGKKVGKIILFIVAAFFGLSILGGMLPDEDEKSSTKKKDVAVEKTENQSDKKTSAPLLYSDFVFGTRKDDIVKILENKGWVNKVSGKDSYSRLTFEFYPVQGYGLFQGLITRSIVLTFDDDTVQDVAVFFDARPDAVRYQGYANLDAEMQMIVDNCILLQDYYEREDKKKDGMRVFLNKETGDIAFLHFEEKIIEENGFVFVKYISDYSSKKNYLKSKS